MRLGIVLSILLGSMIVGLCQPASAGDDMTYTCPRPPLTSWERRCRSGYSRVPAWWARPAVERGDRGYYVGGGAHCSRCAYDRCCNEGTFGWDYATPITRVQLLWYHGRKRQAGAGQYESDLLNHPFEDTVHP